jgi:exopolysaccharide biosynthesis predicted pyruvyltransferase EpsI
VAIQNLIGMFELLFNKIRQMSIYKCLRAPQIVYVLTTPESHSNIGDQAQVVAIYRWLHKNYPKSRILELDKDICFNETLLLKYKKYIADKDVIFIHSGGNLGNLYMWSEIGRRNIIQHFPNNKIIQLPQTVSFTQDEVGHVELRNAQRIYMSHKNLILLGRDLRSAELLKQYFPNICSFAIPDFVLSLEGAYKVNTSPRKNEILLVLRNDKESIFEASQRAELVKRLKPYNCSFYDTTLDHPITKNNREQEIMDLLNYFNSFEAIVTDRYHGLIFSTMLHKPTIVLPTCDHKLTSAFDWFEGIPFLKLISVDELSNISEYIQNLMLVDNSESKDFRKLYFNDLAKKL